MADEPPKRMNYFDRQFLRAADFQVEQAYHLDRHRLHNRLLHTPGIARGLEVTGKTGDTRVSVNRGEAIDNAGREIVLPAQRLISFNATVKDGKFALVIGYDEKKTDDSNDQGPKGPTRTTETPTFDFLPLTDPPAFNELALATIQVDAGGTLIDPPNNSVRTGAGTVVSGNTRFDRITSSMWNVTQLFNKKSNEVLKPGKDFDQAAFTSGGGTLLMFVSASVSLEGEPDSDKEVGTPVGIVIKLDGHRLRGPNNDEKVTISGCATPNHLHTTVTGTLLIPGVEKGDHTLIIQTHDNTKLLRNAPYSLTILEFPF
jgi:hypothetical protein